MVPPYYDLLYIVNRDLEHCFFVTYDSYSTCGVCTDKSIELVVLGMGLGDFSRDAGCEGGAGPPSPDGFKRLLGSNTCVYLWYEN